MDTYPVTPGPIVLAPELLAELLLEVGQSAQELGEFQATLRTEPNRFRSLFGAGRAAEIMRDPGKAWTFYAKLVALYDWADTEALELRQAKAFLGK